MDLSNCSLVLEGGAAKGVFTAGVLDYLMEQDFYTQYVVGVSAGACNAVDYVSKQIGRSKKCFIPTLKEEQYINKRNVFSRKRIYDMDLIFEIFPLELHPFDFDAYHASRMDCEIVVTNCLTGKAEYMKGHKDRDTFMKICRASSSMPFFSDIVYIDDIPYMDGGMADSIPLKRAIDKGYKKHVVILTKNKGYRRKKERLMSLISDRIYAEHPEFRKLIKNGWEQYNETMEQIDKMEREGSLFVIQPNVKTISSFEQNKRKANAFYQNGYELMRERFDELKDYLNA
ncbi:MAG: putative esterase of the alpha-beta hydrolase superfamily [Bacillales bacterium]|jgi:predicted patatin/cPLA2 family phospholipase|nr:putative esterase of the alpha-beta hydrolase superfamily [Bacillales bacterium]